MDQSSGNYLVKWCYYSPAFTSFDIISLKNIRPLGEGIHMNSKCMLSRSTQTHDPVITVQNGPQWILILKYNIFLVVNTIIINIFLEKVCLLLLKKIIILNQPKYWNDIFWNKINTYFPEDHTSEKTHIVSLTIITEKRWEKMRAKSLSSVCVLRI